MELYATSQVLYSPHNLRRADHRHADRRRGVDDQFQKGAGQRARVGRGTAGVLGWDYPTSTTLASMSNCGWTMLAARPDSYWKLVTWNQRAEQLLH